MKTLAFATAIALSATAALAADAKLANYYGNTLAIHSPTGTTNKVFFNKNDTFSEIMADGSTQTGKTSFEADKLCNTFDGSNRKVCMKFDEGHKVGDTWQVDGPNNAKLTFELVKGK